MEREERRRFSTRTESPPPPYSSLYPDSAEVNFVSPRILPGRAGDSGRCRFRQRENFCSHDSSRRHGHQFVIIDKESLKKAKRNEHHSKLKNFENLEAIDIYPDDHHFVSEIMHFHPGHRSEAMIPRQQWGTTFVGKDNIEYPKFVEYAVLSPISPFDVFKSMDKFYASRRLDYTCCIPYFEIKDIKILYMLQYTLVTVFEKKNCKNTPAKGANQTSFVGIVNTSPSSKQHIKSQISHKPSSPEIPNLLTATLCSRCFNLPRASKKSPRQSPTSRCPTQFILCRNCNGEFDSQSHHLATSTRSTLKDSCNSPISECKKPFKPPKIPQEFLERCEGLVVYESPSGANKVTPVTSNEILNEHIIAASKKLLKRHNQASGSGKVVSQKHSISAIPVYQVLCKGKIQFSLWILGTNLQYFDPRFHTHRSHS